MSCSASGEDITPEEFNALMLTFTTARRTGEEVELIPDGKEQLVTWENRRKYADLVLAFKLHEFDPQIDDIRRGLATIVPVRMLTLFTAAEVERSVCGDMRLDVNALKRRTQYRRCRPEDAFVQYFWEVLEELPPEDQAGFLRFAWGRSRLPLSDQDWDGQHMTLCPSGRTPSDLYLPVAQTCFFTLELPPYSSKSVLRERLVKAIRLGTNIDLDTGAEAGTLEWEDTNR